MTNIFVNHALEVEAAMRHSFALGQIYWQQGDSDSWKQQKKSIETLKEFNDYVGQVLHYLYGPKDANQ